jgi:ribose 5-phosphate isomerase B
MKIMIGNDHGGYNLKTIIVNALYSRGIEVEDIGTDSEEIVRYPYYASKVARAVAAGEVERGILICSTGIGMSIAANRYRGVRASLCTSTYMGKMTRAHNDSNILCLGGKVTGEFEALDILTVWLDTPYEGGRHDISLSLICDLEEVLAEEGEWPKVKNVFSSKIIGG